MPLLAAYSHQSVTHSKCSSPQEHTIVLSPAAKLFIQIKRRRAVARLDVGQPLRHNVEKRRIQANGRPDDGDDDPSLRGVVRLPQPVSPAGLAEPVDACGAFPACLPPCLFPRSILYPVCPLSVSPVRTLIAVVTFGCGRGLFQVYSLSPIVVKSCVPDLSAPEHTTRHGEAHTRSPHIS